MFISCVDNIFSSVYNQEIDCQFCALTMEDGSHSQISAHNGQLELSSGVVDVCNKQEEGGNQRTQYSIPGLLNFIRHEWSRFEMERSQWEVDRAEFQKRIALLDGEREGHENLKHYWVRRIKMLECALEQERAKNHKFKYATDLQQGVFDEPVGQGEPDGGETPFISVDNVDWRQGSQLLRQYLREIGHNDNFVDVQSNQVRSLLGLNPSAEGDEDSDVVKKLTGNELSNESEKDRDTLTKETQPSSLNEVMILNTEAYVMGQFEFLAQADVDMDDDIRLSDDSDESELDRSMIMNEDLANDEDGEVEGVLNELTETEDDSELDKSMIMNEDLADDGDGEVEDVLNELTETEDESELDRSMIMFEGLADDGDGEVEEVVDELIETENDSELDKGMIMNESLADDSVDAESEELLNELNLLPETEDDSELDRSMKMKEGLAYDDLDAKAEKVLNELTETEDGSPEIHAAGDFSDRGDTDLNCSFGDHKRPMGELGLGVDEGFLDSTLDLGELSELTVHNEAEPPYSTANTEELRHNNWKWTAKYTLRSHFDGVRALAFHPVDSVLITASEDNTLKLWDLQKTILTRKSASVDSEPLYTFRGHTGAVLCLAMSPTGCQCYSGGLDGAIHCWKLPNVILGPYKPFDPSVLMDSLQEHKDAVWGLSLHSQSDRIDLLSCSSDGTVKLWSPSVRNSSLSSYVSEQDGWPTSVDFVRNGPNRMVAAYNSGACIMYDLESIKPLVRFETYNKAEDNSISSQINRVVAHPNLSLTMTAHENHHIRFFDNSTGKLVHSVSAHRDSVTSLAVDPNGFYLLSGSQDGSVRRWNIERQSFVEEANAHGKKFDESVLDVAFHPSRPYMASAGADGLVRVFVCGDKSQVLNI